MSQNDYSISSAIPLLKHVENAIHNLTNAIDTLEPTHSKFDFEAEKDSMLIRLIFLLDQL